VGGLTTDVLLMGATGLPLVLIGTWLGRRYPPAFGEANMRRVSFALLLAMGIWIGATAWLHLAGAG
jgi:hypothetical protein